MMRVYPICGGRIGARARCFPQATATPPTKYSPPRHLYTVVKTARCTRQFSSTRFAMVAQKIDGTAIAKGIRERLGAQIKEKQAKNPRYRPSLKIVQGKWHAIELCSKPRRAD